MYEVKGIKVKSYIVPGGHTWMNGKQYLATTLQESLNNKAMIVHKKRICHENYKLYFE